MIIDYINYFFLLVKLTKFISDVFIDDVKLYQLFFFISKTY